MKVSHIGEFGLIERLKNILSAEEIGDDTACVNIESSNVLLTSDILLQDRHFKMSYPPQAVGWKAISVNVSDVVANGVVPLFVLVSLLLPDVDVSYVEELYRGIKSACEFYKCKVVGGNVTKSEKLGVDIFMIGITDRFVGRGGAKVGDGVFVSGTLGDSRAGLELLLMEKRVYEDFELALIERHVRPTARIDYIKHIQKYANASMDISDGLSSDVNHLAKRSNVRIEIYREKLPISEELSLFCKKHGKDPYEYALVGGEDYQLLFTHPPERMNPFLDMTQIGYVKEGRGVFINGVELPPMSFDHFKS